MRHLFQRHAITALLAFALGAGAPVRAEMRGHGGPVRALAVLPDGRVAVSGSFDQSAIVWDLASGAALHVLRFHDGAVNAVAALGADRFATGGEDGRIALWRTGETAPVQIIAGHAGPVAGLAQSPDGARLASASWDGTARVTDLATGGGRSLSGHAGPVNAVAFTPAGLPVSGGYDGTVRFWPDGDGAPLVVASAAPVNALAAAPDGVVAAGGADGTLRFLGPDGGVRGEVEIGAGPILALALSPDGTRLAVAVTAGSIALVDRASARVTQRLVGPGLPVWSLAFAEGGAELLTGGSDRLVRRWNARTGEHIGPVAMSRPAEPKVAGADARGAEVFRACSACHTLTPDGGNRAGPSLHGLFGRRIASLPGYNFSEALTKMDIVWTPETVGRLFEIGPTRYTPGTKMPEQTVTDADRAALLRFLEVATR